MAIYAVGDLQGCYDELCRLLDQLNLDPVNDEVWFVGDLVNRGPKSLETLRLVASLGDTATVTLGNHDLHLLASAQNPDQADPMLMPVLNAPDADELLEWLGRRPLVHYRPEMNTLMVHAGLPPAWDPLQTIRLAREVEQRLRSDQRNSFFAQMYGELPDRWSDKLEGMDRLRFITNALTRTRFCYADGRLDFSEKGPPGTQPEDLIPWFELPDRATQSVRIVFGHWASLGLISKQNIVCIDTGCVWGRELTAIRLDGPLRIYTEQKGSDPLS
jgi:bis(5'-nucleosyl)-tetraphosphatase (symmetrical)